ncbi:Efflux transporter, RND family, MFP subunit [Elusimicrobium minutum Pei191]|uniref:Efflux transporter, RND family, MFP subunit n=1 Tax=Elusimicrobium minutum (strain Pei191) TaxID=445932 RepID=B2KAZ1_ELUMP|nr:efflux RND transporter periplasmic adaptor subunit [Elusimicrobium minutum]ACC97687.1 Efflux transporter, RND family, MFP subunit [Elusimicrobium minutum Pei191]
MSKWKIIISVIILAVAGFFFFGKDKNKIFEQIEKDRFSVKLETVEKRNLKNELLLSGSIKALEEATLFPRSEGKLLKNVLKEGQNVKKGQTVSLIERDEVGAVYEPVVVPSTITGIVGKIYLDPGANVTRNTAIAFVVNQSQVRLILDVPERYIGNIFKGQAASFTVEGFPGKTFMGKVNVISPVVDTASRSVTIEILADNEQGLLKSGMFAKADLVLGEKKNAVSVLSSNIFTDEDGVSKYVLVPEGELAKRRNVTLGFVNGGYSEIRSGLQEGEQIIRFTFGIKDGSKISIEK